MIEEPKWLIEEPKWPGTVVRADFMGESLLFVRVFVRADGWWINDEYDAYWHELSKVELLRTGYRGE